MYHCSDKLSFIVYQFIFLSLSFIPVIKLIYRFIDFWHVCFSESWKDTRQAGESGGDLQPKAWAGIRPGPLW